MNKELAYIWGVLKGDGCYCMQKSRHGNKIYSYKFVSLTAKDKDFAIYFKKNLERFLKRKCKIIKTEYWVVYAYHAEIPKIDLNQISNASEKIRCKFIQGFVDSEGHVGKIYRQRRIEITNTDKNFLIFISNLFSQLGIENKIYKLYENHKKWKDCYRILIYKRESFKLFKEKIGFSIKRKNERLEKILSSYKYNDPLKTYQEVMRQINLGLPVKEIAMKHSVCTHTISNWRYNRHKPVGLK